jgi:cytoskeletal protein CcmA (bactofilin family)
MFSKAAKGDTPEVSNSAPRKLSVASLVADGVRLKGDLATEGDLHLDGAVDGDVRVGQLTVGETGAVTGTIHANSVEVRGRVAGTITAGSVRLWATARVDGDISSTELAIEGGAHFVGRSLELATAKAEPLSVVAAE